MILIKFEKEIKGDSKVDGHKDWITCDSFQVSAHRNITMSGTGTDRDTSNPIINELTFTKSTDMSSTDLFAQACGGKSMGKKLEVHLVQTGGDGKVQVYQKWELTDPIVSSYHLSSGGDRPMDSFSVNFTQIKTQYDQFSGDKVQTGTMKGWDLMVNKYT